MDEGDGLSRQTQEFRTVFRRIAAAALIASLTSGAAHAYSGCTFTNNEGATRAYVFEATTDGLVERASNIKGTATVRGPDNRPVWKMIDLGDKGTMFHSPNGGSFGIPVLSHKAFATFDGVMYTGHCEKVNF
jgi:hypothetical protein